MNIYLTEVQTEQLFKDEVLDIKFGKDNIYLELDKNGFIYEEVSIADKENHKGKRKVAFNYEDLQRLVPRKPRIPRDPLYYHNDPLCPKCDAHMIYEFAYCPKCGQHLDWTEG